ncbi:MAG: GGDEF domain-containing protein [Burkholderiaceae bacterium]|nr:GGDEF domain-containing protein [Burkholderiaceae bacterium]
MSVSPLQDLIPASAAAASPWPRALTAASAAAVLTGSVPLLWPQTPWPAALATAAVAALVAGAAAWRRPPAALAAVAPAPSTYTVPTGDAILRDAETGMFHRPAFLALAERDWLRAGRYGGAVALLLVEVDRLRPMTEQMGARVADALLAGLGRQVMASLRAADLLSRFDDAQLAVFLPQADATGALDVADRIREMVERLRLPGLPEGATFTASVGVAVLRPLHQPLHALVEMAQQALQTSREAGGNCVRAANADEPWRPARGSGAGAADASGPREQPGKPERPEKPGRTGDL